MRSLLQVGCAKLDVGSAMVAHSTTLSTYVKTSNQTIDQWLQHVLPWIHLKLTVLFKMCVCVCAHQMQIPEGAAISCICALSRQCAKGQTLPRILSQLQLHGILPHKPLGCACVHVCMCALMWHEEWVCFKPKTKVRVKIAPRAATAWENDKCVKAGVLVVVVGVFTWFTWIMIGNDWTKCYP